MERALSYQQYNGKQYVCVLATIGGRSSNEPFLVPASFWQETEREIILREVNDDSYDQWASAGYPESKFFEF